MDEPNLSSAYPVVSQLSVDFTILLTSCCVIISFFSSYYYLAGPTLVGISSR